MADHKSSPATPLPQDIGRLQQLQRELRAAYVARRRLLYPGYELKDSARWKTAWERGAAICLARNLNPSHLVDVAFSLFQPFPHPNQVHARQSVEAACGSEFVAHNASRAQAQLCSELDAYETYVGLGYAPGEALVAPACYSALFVFAMARGAGADELSERYREAAVTQMQVGNREYVELLRSRLGSEFLPMLISQSGGGS